MSKFISTVELIGDSALTDSIIDRSITEIEDKLVTKLRSSVLAGCASLTSVVFESVQTIGANAFSGCPSLKSASLPNLTSESGRAFQDCSALENVYLPKVQAIGGNSFWGCRSLKTLDLPSVTVLYTYCFYLCPLTTLILRSPTVCVMQTAGTVPGSAKVYVPAALVNEYKAATNWSAISGNILALEEWTDDGTVHGNIDVNFAGYAVSYKLSHVSSSNYVLKAGRRYATTLTANTEIEEVSVTMGGVDITAEVYNAETGEINIPMVTGDLVITAKAAKSEGTEELPSGYTSVDSISMSGQQYINFSQGLNAHSDSLVIRFTAVPAPSVTNTLFASGTYMTTSLCKAELSPDSKLCGYIGASGAYNYQYAFTSLPPDSEFKLSGGIVSLNGTEVYDGRNTTVSAGTTGLSLFSGGSRNHFIGDVHGVELNLAGRFYNLVPAIKDETGEVGLFDTMASEFFASSSGTPFE